MSFELQEFKILMIFSLDWLEMNGFGFFIQSHLGDLAAILTDDYSFSLREWKCFWRPSFSGKGIM